MYDPVDDGNNVVGTVGLLFLLFIFYLSGTCVLRVTRGTVPKLLVVVSALLYLETITSNGLNLLCN